MGQRYDMQIGVLVRQTFLGGRNNLISWLKPQEANLMHLSVCSRRYLTVNLNAKKENSTKRSINTQEIPDKLHVGMDLILANFTN